MSAKDDDSTLTQLATAWVDMYMGGAKVKEAFDIFQELGDKYNWTVGHYYKVKTVWTCLHLLICC